MNLREEIINKENQRLAWQFHVSRNSCDNPEYYEDYLKFIALSDFNTGFTTTHLLIDKDADKLAGFCSLRCSGLGSKDGEGHVIINRPALEIAELAVDENYERIGVGSFLVHIAADTAYKLRKEYCGVRSVVLSADPNAVGFYLKNHFEKLSDTYEPLIELGTIRCVPMYFNIPENI